MAFASPPLLLALVHGVDMASLTALRQDSGSARAAALPLTGVPQDPAGCLLGPADACGALRDLGVAVDRSSLLFQTAGRPDEAMVAGLGRRATGTAAVTMLEFTSVLAAARAGGCAAVPEAVARLAGLLAYTADRLRVGDRPETWLVGLDAPQPVHTMFDVRRHWQRQVVAPLSAELRLAVQEQQATVVAGNQRALAFARHVLGSPPFAAHGTVVMLRPDTLQLVAGPGIGFGRQRIGARAPHRAEAEAAALLPCAPRTAGDGLDFRGLLARFWMRAAALHATLEPIADRRHTEVAAAEPHTVPVVSR